LNSSQIFIPTAVSLHILRPAAALRRMVAPSGGRLFGFSPLAVSAKRLRADAYMKAEEEEFVDMSAQSPSGVGRASRLDQRSLLEEEEEEEVEEDEEE